MTGNFAVEYWTTSWSFMATRWMAGVENICFILKIRIWLLLKNLKFVKTQVTSTLTYFLWLKCSRTKLNCSIIYELLVSQNLLLHVNEFLYRVHYFHSLSNTDSADVNCVFCSFLTLFSYHNLLPFEPPALQHKPLLKTKRKEGSLIALLGLPPRTRIPSRGFHCYTIIHVYPKFSYTPLWYFFFFFYLSSKKQININFLRLFTNDKTILYHHNLVIYI